MKAKSNSRRVESASLKTAAPVEATSDGVLAKLCAPVEASAATPAYSDDDGEVWIVFED